MAAWRAAVTPRDVSTAETRLRLLLAERHGAGTVEWLIAELQRPCVTFAAIAQRLGVTRERVRQWQMKLLPDAPRGHQRQRLCAQHRKKRILLEEPLFRRFYQHARGHLAAGRIELIKSHQGYRTRSIRIDHCVLVLARARLIRSRKSADTALSYTLAPARGAVDFGATYPLTADDYLLVPAAEVPAEGATYTDRPGTAFRKYKNTFDALLPAVRRETA